MSGAVGRAGRPGWSAAQAAARRPPNRDPEPMDRPLPDVLATLKAEYFVEWQVADTFPLAHCSPSGDASSQ